MAKKKMTFEEKLEEAIVKDAPYEVPDNWIWSNVGSISLEIKNGTTIKQNKDEIGIKVTRIESLQNNGIDLNRLGTIIETEKIKEQDYYIDGDIALSHINSLEHVGKTALIDNSLLPLVHGMNLLRIRVNKRMILPKYFQLYTRGYDYKKFVVDRVNRAVNQVSLNQKNLSDVPMPIPPLKEQQRIVDKIESLFEKLDKAKELIEEARDDFEKRKSAILEKAFRGELTKKWRLKNNIKFKSQIASKILNDKKNANIKELKDRGEIDLGFSIPEQWEQCILNDISAVDKDSLVDGPFGSNLKTCDYTESGVRLIQLQNIGVGYWKDSNKKFVSEDKAKELSRCIALPGDIAIAKMAAPTARATLIPDFEEKYVIVADCIKLSVDHRVSTKYIMYCINSPKINNIAERLGKGTTRKRINLGDLKKIPIPLPSFEEQEEIVRILDSLLEEESKIEELTKLDDQIELIKKSILAKAFRGQLGTNSEDDESAIELLKEILNK